MMRARNQLRRGPGRYVYFLLYYLRSLVGIKRPLLGGVKLTHACNLTCTHCPFWRRGKTSLSFAQAVASLKALHDMGARMVILEGGEPFLWRDGEHDLSDVVREAKKLFFFVGITTNGTFPIGTDADIVWVSVDGLRDTHDRIRGESFDLLLHNIETSSHPRIFAHITVNAANADEVRDLVHLLAPRVAGITAQLHYPYEGLADDLSLSADRRASVLDDLVDLKRCGLPIADSRACLKALKQNTWRCQPWMIASVDPDGSLVHGCYVKNRGTIACDQCGFSVHTEISLAYRGSPGALLTGLRIFG